MGQGSRLGVGSSRLPNGGVERPPPKGGPHRRVRIGTGCGREALHVRDGNAGQGGRARAWVGNAGPFPWPSVQAGHALAGGDGCSLCALAPCLWSISRVVAPFGGTIDLGLEYERNRTILASRRCPPRSRRLTVPSNTCQGAEMVTPRGGPFLAFREESRWWEGWEARRGPSRARGEGRSMANHLPAPHAPSRHQIGLARGERTEKRTIVLLVWILRGGKRLGERLGQLRAESCTH